MKRYAAALKKYSKSLNVDWKLLFIIPDWNANQSVDEFVDCHKHYPANCNVATWMKGSTSKIRGAIDPSISELLNDLSVLLDDDDPYIAIN